MFPRHAVIITAAGSSDRFNAGTDCKTKKEFAHLNGKSVIYNAAKPFFEVPNLAAVLVTYKANTLEQTKICLGDLLEKDVPVYFVEGGSSRQKSVFNALCKLSSINDKLGAEVVCIHDGARPFVTKETIMDCIVYSKLFGSAAPGVPVADTLVHVDEEGFIDGRLERSGAYQIQTPQTFMFNDICLAHQKANEMGLEFTDDTQLLSLIGKKVAVVAGSIENRKITFSSDIERDSVDCNTIGCTGNCSSCHGLCVKEEE